MNEPNPAALTNNESAITNAPAKCRGCGRPIFWFLTVKGKRTPVDVETVRVLQTTGVGASGYVSHFATCPEAAQFKRKKS